jgi:aromatic-L-amino-acid decarboxylase
VDLAQKFKAWVEKSDRFELAAPAPLNLVCFRHVGGDAINENLLESLNATGQIYLTHTSLGGKYTLRMAIGQGWTYERHVTAAWKLIQQTSIEVEPTV